MTAISPEFRTATLHLPALRLGRHYEFAPTCRKR